MAIAAEILTVLKANASQFKSEVAGAQGSTESFAGGMSKTAAVGGAAFAALGVAAVAIGAIGVKMALDGEVNQARLTTAIKTTGHAYAEYGDEIDKLKSKSRDLGFSGGEVTQSLTKLVTATKDTHKAVGDMSLAQDIARGRNIDLAAATDILVKVESGRVSALSRIGIQTKDATGATISQHEALKRLTDLYGGQAAAYSETFRGKMAALDAQIKFIVSSIGAKLIPILTWMMSALADTFSFFERNRTAAIALAVAIGGPLVYAMGAWIVSMALAGGAAVASAWETLALRAMYLADALLAAAPAAAAFAVAVALPVAAALALGYGLHSLFGGFDEVYDAFKRGRSEGKALADDWVAAAQKSDTPIKLLREDLSALNVSHQQHLAAVRADGGGFNEAAQEALRYHTANAALKKAIAETSAEHEKNLVVTKSVAKQLGVEIPNAASLSSTELKALQSAVGAATDKFGVMATQAALDAGMTGDALKQVTSDADNFAKSIEGSISKFTDVFSHQFEEPFGVVGPQAMEDFFVGSQQQAADWANEITDLIHRGVSKGIIDQMAAAGPGSKPSLDAFVQMVDDHGVEWVNSVSASAKQAAAYTEAAYNDMAIATAVKLLETTTVAKAEFDALAGHGTAKLEELLHSSDKNMAAMAYGAILHLHEIGVAVDTVPKEPHIHFNLDTADAHYNLSVLGNAIAGIVNQPYNIHVGVIGEVDSTLTHFLGSI